MLLIILKWSLLTGFISMIGYLLLVGLFLLIYKGIPHISFKRVYKNTVVVGLSGFASAYTFIVIFGSFIFQ